MKQIKEVRVDNGLTLDTAHICDSVCLQTAPPLISSQCENDLDSAGCWVCLHTQHTDDIVSQTALLSAASRGMLLQ